MPNPRRLAVSRACDSCRKRKVKCDATRVCGNCQISQLPCEYTLLPRKRGPKQRKPSDVTQDLPSQRHSPTTSDTPEIRTLSGHGRDAFPSEDATWTPLSISTVAESPSKDLAQTIHSRLLRSITPVLSSPNKPNVVYHCIDLYVQYIFPTAPYVHESSLRSTAARFFADPQATDLFSASSWYETVGHLRAYSLLTALCAAVASIVPKSQLSQRETIVEPCLVASRNTLKIFEDFDVEHPTSSSLSTRIMHSIALQQITGKTGLAYYVLGQAALLAKNMHLHREESLKGLDDIEAQMLRNVFWHLYSSDQASICFLSRAFVFHDLLFDIEVSPRGVDETFVPLLDTTQPSYEKNYEKQLLSGWSVFLRLWLSAARLIFDLRIARSQTEDPNRKARLTQAFMVFMSVPDCLPVWLQASNLITDLSDGMAAQFQKCAFWVQRCSILVTFHCLRLIVLQQCVDSDLLDIMGLRNETLTLSMAKIGIAYDFIQILNDIPFIYLQVKGEPTVERIRKVGSMLLEMSCTDPNETLKKRASSYFSQLLDILTRLDSKASDEMSRSLAPR
ncbi:hypothetical protein GQ53DRAFT_870585 [Thozetella sp. PMI_491]|nr:hypothetical protein GQ53DRAFT_870585 [Thozetella sp. PMI_491]